MKRLDPELSFVPTVEAALVDETVVVVKDAASGQPIRRWVRGWRPEDGEPPKVTGDLYERLAPTHPHSVYVQTLAEQGIIGAVVLGWVLVAGIWTLLRSACFSPLGCGLLGGMVAWMIASVFEGQHLSGQALSILMIPLALGGMGLLPAASGQRAT